MGKSISARMLGKSISAGMLKKTDSSHRDTEENGILHKYYREAGMCLGDAELLDG